jgi:hypothetical protein
MAQRLSTAVESQPRLGQDWVHSERRHHVGVVDSEGNSEDWILNSPVL